MHIHMHMYMRVEREPHEERRVGVERRVVVHEPLRLRCQQLCHIPPLSQPFAVAAPGRMVLVVVTLTADKAVLRIEAASKRAARRVVTRARARVEVKLAHDRRAVAQRSEHLWKKQAVAAERCPAKGRADADLPRVPTGQEGCARWRAPGRRAEVRERDATPRERVQVRRLDHGRASVRGVVEAHVVGHVHHDVWPGLRRGAAAQRRQRGHADGCVERGARVGRMH